MSDTPVGFSVNSNGFHVFRLFIKGIRLHPNGSGTSPGCDIRRAVAESGWALGLKGTRQLTSPKNKWKPVGKLHIFPSYPLQKRDALLKGLGSPWSHGEWTQSNFLKFQQESLTKATHWATGHTCSIERCRQPGQSWRKVILPMSTHFSSISTGHWYKLWIYGYIYIYIFLCPPHTHTQK